MVDNIAKYGFRWFGGTGGAALLKPEPRIIASGTQFDVTGGIQDAVLQAGDVVKLVSDGTVALCAGAETTPDTPWGVVVGGLEYYDSSIGQAGAMRKASSIPNGTTWTGRERATKCLVVPFMPGQLWEVDVDDIVTATTLAAYEAFIGENVSMINAGAASSTPAWIKPKLDISSHATTATLMFRIRQVSPTKDNVDFAGANVKLLVEANIANAPVYQAAATGSPGV